jgi:hypothetical protein
MACTSRAAIELRIVQEFQISRSDDSAIRYTAQTSDGEQARISEFAFGSREDKESASRIVIAAARIRSV